MITHAVKMLTSPALVRGGMGVRTEGHENQWWFLAGQWKSATENRRGDVSSIWNRLRPLLGKPEFVSMVTIRC